MDYAALQKWLGVEFRNKDLLTRALTHRSWWNEGDDKETRARNNNQRLEFLGDAVLDLVVKDYLFTNYPDKPEGDLTFIRSKFVSGSYLATVGNGGDLFDHMLMSKGERTSATIRGRQNTIEDAVEALIAAIYLDQGLEAAAGFIKRRILSLVDQVACSEYRDPKSVFAERAQAELKITPTYRRIEEGGPDHARRFIIGTYLGEILVAKGHGPSVKDAEFKAAEAALIMRGWAPSPI